MPPNSFAFVLLDTALFYSQYFWSPLYTLTPNTYNLNLRIKTEPVTVVADATVVAWFPNQICVNKSRDRLGFYAKIQIIFGTVYRIRCAELNLHGVSIAYSTGENKIFV